MSSDAAIRINDELRIPLSELSIEFATSGGPGGQHVNKTATKVILRFDVTRSPSLSTAQRDRIRAKLESRISREGMLQVQAQDTRSQRQNRELATERFRALLAGALEMPKPRRRTKPSRAAIERRLSDKKRRADAKRRRRYSPDHGG